MGTEGAANHPQIPISIAEGEPTTGAVEATDVATPWLVAGAPVTPPQPDDDNPHASDNTPVVTRAADNPAAVFTTAEASHQATSSSSSSSSSSPSDHDFCQCATCGCYGMKVEFLSSEEMEGEKSDLVFYCSTNCQGLYR